MSRREEEALVPLPVVCKLTLGAVVGYVSGKNASKRKRPLL